MDSTPADLDLIEVRITQLFALVAEALARATDALLSNDAATGLSVVEGDQDVDELTADVELLVWRQLDDASTPNSSLRHLVGVLLILPELERSGDLAEHIAQRAMTNLGAEMSPLSRGIVMSRIMRFGLSVRVRSIACSPSAASPQTSQSGRDFNRCDLIPMRTISWSSTIRIRAFIFALLKLALKLSSQRQDETVEGTVAS